MNCEENKYDNCELSEQRYLEQLQSEEDSNDYHQQQEWEEEQSKMKVGQIMRKLIRKSFNHDMCDFKSEYIYSEIERKVISEIDREDIKYIDNAIELLEGLKRDVQNYSNK